MFIYFFNGVYGISFVLFVENQLY